MNNDFEVSVEQEVDNARMGRPHVVVLGAGASRAACLNGDKNGNILPLMKDFTKVLGLEPLLNEWGINADQNFEEIFSDLYEQQKNEEISQIENAVEKYLDQLELPDKPTIYDHLVLSLRKKDLIATFNWDPLLIHAYIRNGKAGLKLPRLAFLHGNIRVGYCENDKVVGLACKRCRRCGDIYKRAPLLYPIKRKDYAKELFIANEWESLKWGFQNAFMITIFGYSGPKTDQEAIAAMKEAWGDKYQRSMEQTAFITTQSEDEISENWDSFIHSHHYEIHDDFYNSWIANHPRRTGEAYLNQYYEARFISNNPIPRDLDFPELWEWYEKFKTAEDKTYNNNE
ncbi:MAG: hypothetical protein ABSG97_07265 [Sedimentisphaerales bacterium]|jgi:hypothetical protein